jgi:hypothetical protein
VMAKAHIAFGKCEPLARWAKKLSMTGLDQKQRRVNLNVLEP